MGTSTIRQVVRDTVDASLGKAGLVRRKRTHMTDYRDYIPFPETMAGASAAGMSVGDYVEHAHGTPGSTQQTIDKMAELGAFDPAVEHICEIGPGTGRYLQRALARAAPGATCEIYETAEEWRDWLVTTHGAIARSTDGRTLADTESASVDLVQAHKVLSGQPTLVTCSYLREMARVVKPGGHVVFDAVTERCMDNDTVDTWLETLSGYQHYPCLLPRQFIVDQLAARGVELVGSFVVEMHPGSTECMVFAKVVSGGE